MNETKIVTIVGRPNVGKSRLFNRLAQRRISIVHDKPGVTRDLVTIEMPDGYTLMDTGGIGLEDKSTPRIISEAMQTQVMIAIESSSLILFVTDGKEGLTPLDMQIADTLHNHHHKVILVVNKIDNPDNDSNVYEFSSLGFGDPFAVSAEHNLGLVSLERAYLERLGPLESTQDSREQMIKLCLVGKPNAGKSSLGNRLLNSERFIVTDVAGTTRDMVETTISYKDRKGADWKLTLFDTAGLRPKKKVDNSVEYFSSVRTERSIEYSDVVLHLIDAREGVSKQDKIIAGQVLESGKALIVVVTKWDYAVEAFHAGEIEDYASLNEFRAAYEHTLRKQFFYLPDSPVIFISSKSGDGIDMLMETVIRTHKKLDTRIPTPKLNRAIAELFEKRQPSKVVGKRFKVFYALQTGNRPFRIKVFCNRAETLQHPYRRYLEKSLVEAFDLQGCPMLFNLVGKEERYRKPEK